MMTRLMGIKKFDRKIYVKSLVLIIDVLGSSRDRGLIGCNMKVYMHEHHAKRTRGGQL